MDIQQMMQQAKVMQERMQRLQEELSDREVSGQSGGGMVEVVMTCKGEVRNLNISQDLVNPNDKETLEDLVVAAINMARQNADQLLASETQKMMEELGLPTNVDMPF